MKSLDDLRKIKERVQEDIKLREGKEMIKIIVGMGTCGINAGAREIMNTIIDEIEKRNLHNVAVTQTGCIGLCTNEPLVDVVVPGQAIVTYGQVSKDKIKKIISQHVVNGKPIPEWILHTRPMEIC